MKATFELDDTIEEKHFFPHYFNKTANYENELPHLPDKKYYGSLYRNMSFYKGF